MTRRSFLSRCLAVAAAMVLPAAKAAGADDIRWAKMNFRRTPIIYTPRLDADRDEPIYSIEWKVLPTRFYVDAPASID